MKKFVTLALALAMCASLAVPASAAKTVVSNQNLTIDGTPVTCEKYNIDGSNYFKLRDLAALLYDSPAQFNVGYDAETNTVTITTGEAYEEVGGELEIGADKSATAKESRQTIIIDGYEADYLSVYNIGGNNYFKLRDLGEALMFCVDYDADTRTAQIGTYYSSKETFTYAEDGTITGVFKDNNGDSYTEICAYDENGVETKCLDIHDGAGPEVFSITEFDEHDNPVKVTYPASEGGQEFVITYDITYDKDGREVKSVESLDGTARLTTEYSYVDATTVKCVCTGSDTTYTMTVTLDENNQPTCITYVYEDGRTESVVSTNTYDDEGRLIAVETFYQ